MSEEGTKTTRRRGASTAAPATLPDNEDLLREFLLRLPPDPSSLPRASAVCRLWRSVATDPKFIRRFRVHHRSSRPPLLGVFHHRNDEIAFTPVLDPPNRVPPDRFSLGRHNSAHRIYLLGCRRGRVLLLDSASREVVVCDPIAGEQHLVVVPLEFVMGYLNGAVLCAADHRDHVHGSPFKVVLISLQEEDNRPVACVYSSETAKWGNLIASTARCRFCGVGDHGILVGRRLYWYVRTNLQVVALASLTEDIVEFDLDKQSLAMINGPPGLDHNPRHQIIRAEDGSLGLATFASDGLQMWRRKVNCHGVATWLLQKTLKMHDILGLAPRFEGMMMHVKILGYDEDNDVIFLHAVDANVYTVELKSMKSRRFYEAYDINQCQYVILSLVSIYEVIGHLSS